MPEQPSLSGLRDQIIANATAVLNISKTPAPLANPFAARITDRFSMLPFADETQLDVVVILDHGKHIALLVQQFPGWKILASSVPCVEILHTMQELLGFTATQLGFLIEAKFEAEFRKIYSSVEPHWVG